MPSEAFALAVPSGDRSPGIGVLKRRVCNCYGRSTLLPFIWIQTSNSHVYVPTASPKSACGQHRRHLVAYTTQTKQPQSCRNSTPHSPPIPPTGILPRRTNTHRRAVTLLDPTTHIPRRIQQSSVDYNRHTNSSRATAPT